MYCGLGNNQRPSLLLSPFLPLAVPDAEHEWTGPFFFIQAADPQLGLMKAWRDGDCDGGGEEWAEEVELTKQAVEAVNQLRPRPRFVVLCGDLVHAMPGRDRAHEGQAQRLLNFRKKLQQHMLTTENKPQQLRFPAHSQPYGQ